MSIARKIAGWLFHRHEWRIKRRGKHRFMRCETCKAEKWLGKDA